MPQFQSSAWWNEWQGDDTPRNRDAGGCNNNDHEISRHRKGRKGRRRHWCVSADGQCAPEQGGDCRGGDHIRYNSSRQGHNPCKSADAIKYIGVHQGGVESGQKATDFQNSDIGLKCNWNEMSDGRLRGWYNNHLKKHAGVKGHRGDGQGQHKFRSIWEQALFGIKTSAGTETAGYCLNTANLMKDIGGGNTCYQKIKDEITATKAEAEARKWCESNRSNPKCKCVNVVEAGGTNFINHCKGKYNVVAGKPKARFVWFGFDNRKDYLNIAQIEVFTGEKDSKGNMINILRKTLADGSEVPNPAVTITASSTHSSGQYGPDKLNDGNYVSIYHSETGHQSDHILVDLGKLTTIDSIKVWNRQPCDNHGCEKRWRGALIKLKDPFGNEVARTERIVGDHMEDGKRVKTFDTFVTKDDGWAGCDEIVRAYKKFEDAGLTSASGLFGNADCLVPGICDGDKIVPTSGKPGSCANKLAICDQRVGADNIKAQNLLIEQGCEINFEADSDAPDGQTPPPPPPPPTSSGKTSSTPVTSSSSNDDDDDDDGEEKEFYEKTGFQIGGGVTSIVSMSSSCFMLLLVLAM
tara:strand:- start:15 stop:1751 length:1737 start_codon:yes stop_codon:yes gene_type:complete